MRRLGVLMAVLIGSTESLFPGALDDYSQARQKQDAQGCLNLGLAYAKGIETEKNYELAKDYLGIACDLGNVQACTELKDVDQHRNDSSAGASDTEQDNKIVESKEACDRGDGAACSRLGVYYEDGKRVKRNYAKAAEYYKKGCDLGDSVSCRTLGTLYSFELGNNYIKAAEYYKKGCDLGDNISCLGLGVWYELGIGLSAITPKQQNIIKKPVNLVIS